MSKLEARLSLVRQAVTMWIGCEGSLGLFRSYGVVAGVLRCHLKCGFCSQGGMVYFEIMCLFCYVLNGLEPIA